MWARFISGIIGVFMLLSAFNWLIDPSGAAESLAMNLLEGEGGNTLWKHFNFISFKYC